MNHSNHDNARLHTARMLRKVSVVLVALVAFGAFALAGAAPPDRILFNAEILTMEPARPTATAIAVTGQEISAVGSNRQVLALAGPRTEVIDARGHTVIPGLIDSHMHAVRGGQTFTFENYWYRQRSLAEALQALKAEASRRGPGRWVAVVGAWHPAQFSEKRAPTREDLDQALLDNPAYVQYLYDWGLLNGQGIAALALDAGGTMPAGVTIERDAAGKATGRVTGAIGALSGLFARLSTSPPAQRRDSLTRYFQELNGMGITGIVDPAPGDYASLGTLFDLWRAKALTVRVGYRISSLARDNEEQWFRSVLAAMPPNLGDERLRFVGIGESLVAGMNDGVRQAPGFAAPAAAKEELYKVGLMAAERGYPLEIHAYTDDAANQILDVFERVSQTHDLHGLRWMIAHMNTGRRATFDRMYRLGIGYTVQMGPYFEAAAILETNGADVAEATPPVRAALDAGLVVAGGTDSTRIGQINVWRAIEYHVTGRAVGDTVRRRADLALSREVALQLFTRNAAWVSSDEQRRGSIAVGKLADLAVLDKPYLRVPADEIHDLRSVLTLVGGTPVHRADPSPLGVRVGRTGR